jgi:hypothetical protein
MQKTKATPKKTRTPTDANRVEVRNPNAPHHVSHVDATKYNAMKKALLKTLPRKAPGLTQAEMMSQVVAHLPQEHFPGGEKAGWWCKCVQLDLEVRGEVVRELGKPLRWHRAK